MSGDQTPKAKRDLDEYVARHGAHPELETQREPVVLEAGNLDDLMHPGTDRLDLDGKPGPRLAEVAHKAGRWWDRARFLVAPLVEAEVGKLGSDILRGRPWEYLNATDKCSVVRVYWDQVWLPYERGLEPEFIIDPLARAGGHTEGA
jgi:hypothetical protein